MAFVLPPLVYTLLKIAIAGAVIGAILFVAALKLYAYLSCGVCKSQRKMNGKVVIVTGATSGIGKETARDLAKRGAKIILACRNVDKANETKDELIQSTENNNIVVKKLDLSSQKSIREFAEDLHKCESKIDVLIHNAGTAETRTKVTDDGLEMTMATNHFGPFLLTHLLIDLLKKAESSRIVVVASELYRLASLNLDRLNPLDSYVPIYLYYVSKYANICFTKELARRLEGTGVTANCLHPGMIDSGIYRNVPAPFSWAMWVVIKGFFKTPEQGAQTTIHAAVSEGLEGVTGKYFMDCRERYVSSGANNQAKAKKFWELSEKFCNMLPTDPKI